MNYYEHHLGDYVRDTAHLSMLEDGAYRRLMDACYIRERPLPRDLKECCKLARAASKPEREAVTYVLKEFFEEREDGFHQRRVDAEIERFQSKSRKAKASADARWQACERNANASDPHMPTQCESDALQSPVTSNQSPVTKESEKDTDPLRGIRVNGKHPRPKPKSPLPPDFELTEPMRQQAITRFSDCDTQAMFEQFKAYHEREGSAYKSWPAAWTTWIGNAEKFGYPKQRTTERKWD